MWTPYNFYNFVLFDNWLDFSGAVPSIYWNVYSEEQRYKFLCKRLQKLVEYVNKMGVELNLQADAINKLARIFEDFKEHGFEDYYADQVKQWIDEHMEFIFDHVVKQVYFGLTLDGHFVAYIPDSWDDIIFDTGFDYDKDTYGRLILRWNTENARMVNQTPEYNQYGISTGRN